MIKYLLEKEFRQVLRNPFMLRLILAFPCLVILVFPWAASMEIKNINLTVIDNNRSDLSEQLTRKAAASEYFELVNTVSSFQEGMKDIENGSADILLEIPADFEQNLIREGKTQVLIAANTVNGSKGAIGSSYLTTLVQDFAGEQRNLLYPQKGNSGIGIVMQNRYNPHLDYKVFMIPALMVMLLTMLCGFLPALNIVEEKEKGTIEQMNVTPVRKFDFILAKLIPYWVIGLTALTICFLLAWLIYGLTPAGSLITLYLFVGIYILAISGMGLVISNYSDTMQQAMFVIFFFMMVFMLLSGLFTPISSMPDWAQAITAINPLKYLMQVMRMVFLKGSSVTELGSQALALILFALFFNTWAILSYRKKS